MDIDDIKSRLLVKYPPFASIIVNNPFVPSVAVETAATDGKQILYNPSFVEGLSEDEQIFLFAHEVLHIAFKHITRSEGKDPKTWNIATDSVVNAILKEDGLPIIDGGIDMPEAIDHNAEEMYEELMEEKEQEANRNGNKDGEKSESDDNGKEGQNGNGDGSDSEEKDDNKTDSSSQDSSSENSQSDSDSQESTAGDEEKQQESDDSMGLGMDDGVPMGSGGSGGSDSNGSQGEQESEKSEGSSSGSSGGSDSDSSQGEQNAEGSDGSQEEQESEKSEGSSSGSSGGSGGSDSNGDKDSENSDEKESSNSSGEGNDTSDQGSSGDGEDGKDNEVGHDSHTMWAEAVEKAKNNKDNENSDNKDGNQESEEEIDEQEIMNEIKKEREKELKEYKKSLVSKSLGHGTSPGNMSINIEDIGKAKPLVDWRRVLRESINYDEDWSYKNAEFENGVLNSRLEEFPTPETEILLDTSGSIDDDLLRNFLRECKNILKDSRVKVGCFDTRFYGFTEIRKFTDIEDLQFVGRGGTDFNAAVDAFSLRTDNKIIFTDGEAPMPEEPIDAIWVVFGGKKINPPGGRVIYVNEDDLKKVGYVDYGKGHSK